jgi:hypothetical protein
MSHSALSSGQRRERERVVFFKIIGPLAAVALVYGVMSAHPPVLFLAGSGLLGMGFTAILLWGNRKRRAVMGISVALVFLSVGRFVIEHTFFARPFSPDDMPWPFVIAELAAIGLGCTIAFPLFRYWERATDQPNSGA